VATEIPLLSLLVTAAGADVTYPGREARPRRREWAEEIEGEETACRFQKG